MQCLTCQGEHAYRRPKSERAESTPRARTPKKPRGRTGSSRTNPSAAWAQAVEGVAAEDFRAYNMYEHFEPGEFVNHKKFGRGAVLSLQPPDKIECLFEQGQKTLIMGRERKS